MPGKVNPVIPEMTMQCAMKVMADDQAICLAAAHGEFELNAFFPLIADCLLESLQLLTRTVELFRSKCIETLRVDVDQCRKHLEESTAFATAYTPRLGYDVVSKVIKENGPVEGRKILEQMVKEL